ncbi:LysE family translocator [Nonomuraea sp. NPDC050451]|uniref:LysE family translocator n=1 Tax=Nonomuraea sp. NPDC050451 TaxID=3364364 RepID=UPI0037AACAD4
MDIAGSVWSFALVAAFLTLTPGLDTALILRTSLLAGRRAAWGVTLGIQLGTLTWGVLTAAGLSALLAASRLGYESLRWAGVAYLVWMGLRMLLAKAAPHDEPEQAVRFGGVAEGLLWSAALIGFASLVSGFLRTPAVRRFLDRLTGVVIVGFGIRLAVTD